MSEAFNTIITRYIEAQYEHYAFLIHGFEKYNFKEIISNFFKDELWKHANKHEVLSEKILSQDLREIVDFVNKTSFNDLHKFVIVFDVEKIDQNSLNIILKTVEEPSIKTIFFFMTNNIYKILPTLQSRCFEINLDYLDRIKSEIIDLDYSISNDKKMIIDYDQIDFSVFLEDPKLLNIEKINDQEWSKIKIAINKLFLSLLENIANIENSSLSANENLLIQKILQTKTPNDIMQLIEKFEELEGQIIDFNCDRKFLLYSVIDLIS